MKAENIEGLTPVQSRDRFALPDVPKYVCDVKIDAEKAIRCGIAGKQPGWGDGGGLQFDLIQQNIGDFTNSRLLP